MRLQLQQRYHDLGEIIVSTAGLDLLTGSDDMDDILSSGSSDLLFGGNELFFGNDLLFGSDVDAMSLIGADNDPDIAALASVISGSDDLGDVDIAGAMEIIGATGNGAAKRQAIGKALARRKKLMALRGLLAQQKQNTAKRRLQGLANIGIQPTLAVDKGYTKARRFPFGLQADGVTPAGAPGNVTRRPQTPIKVQRLVIPSTIAPAFVITDVKVGKDSQLVGSDPIPAITFAENAVAVELTGDTANVGHDVTIAFANISGAPQQFRAVIIGAAVE
jgi:hypothetical protein